MLSALPSAPRVVASGNFATPATLLATLDTAVPEYQLFVLNPQRGLPDREGVTYETAFVGPGMRNSPRLRYYPCRLSRVPHLFQEVLHPDVVLLHTTVPDDGTLSLGLEVNILPAAVEAARARGGLVIAQVNRAMPTTFGDATMPLDAVDYIVEVDEPMAYHHPIPLDDVSQAIGARIAALVPDGATLQLGIGGIPDATLAALLQHRSLMVWSEMFSDGVLALERAGCIDRDVPITASFIFGSQELYDWVDNNKRIQMLRSEKTNAPGIIAEHPNVFSVNSALEVDLFAQANASRVRGQIYSGFGGQTDFIVGALHSPGGQAIMALRSWQPKANVSTVVPVLTGPVTSFQHSYIVTEQGAAAIWGYDQATQAQHIIDHAAHPSVRDELRDAANAMGLGPT
ncbi:acetyl-CoA hydrolase/transferase family protein [Luedemannella flava]